MGDWMHNLPIGWMALVVFAITYLVTGAILGITSVLAKGERVRILKGILPLCCHPLGLFSA